MLSFTAPVFQFTPSAEIGPNAPPLIRTGIRSVEVLCSCGHAWTARAGDPFTRPALGGLLVTCPSCASDGVARVSDLE